MKSFQLAATQDTVTPRGVEAGSRTVPEGSVFLVVRGMILAHTFPVCVAGRTMAFNQDVKALIPAPDVNGRFLGHWFVGHAHDMLGLVTESTHGTKRIDLRDLTGFPTRLPSAPEQVWVAEVLDTVDDAIRGTEQVIAKLEQVKRGLLHDLLTRGIDDNGELRDPERHPEQFKDSPLGRIPKAWDVSGIAQHARPERPYIKTGPFGSSLKGEHWVEKGVPVITIGALGEGAFNAAELLHVSSRTAQRLAGFAVEAGDLVFSRVADVGRSVVVEPEHTGWIMSSNLMWISLDPATANPYFLWLNLSGSSATKSQIRRSVNAGGREVANGSVLRSLRFPWPSATEQGRIVGEVQALRERERSCRATLEKLRLLKQGLMDDLLTGRVRVPLASGAT
jgi:type I restriction enzyme S subunit